MKPTEPITSKMKLGRTLLTPWVVVLVVTLAIVTAYSLYIPNPADTARVATLIKEQATPDFTAEEVIPKTPNKADETPASTENANPGFEEKIEAAKQLPQTREVTEYIERLSRQAGLRDKVLTEMDKRIREVEALSPTDAARSLRETMFSRQFSPKIASALYGLEHSPVTVLKDAMNDPLVAKVFAVVNDPSHPDYIETCDAVKAEAEEYVTHATFPFAFKPGTALVLPMLLIEAVPPIEAAQLLQEMITTLSEAENAALATFPDSTPAHMPSDMSRMLAYSIESLFGEIYQDDIQLSQLSPEQSAVIMAFGEYIEERRQLTDRAVSILGHDTNETDSQQELDNADIDDNFWEVRDLVPVPRTPNSTSLTHGSEHELHLFYYLNQFVTCTNTTKGDSPNENY